jgi:hypothetical protein
MDPNLTDTDLNVCKWDHRGDPCTITDKVVCTKNENAMIELLDGKWVKGICMALCGSKFPRADAVDDVQQIFDLVSMLEKLDKHLEDNADTYSPPVQRMLRYRKGLLRDTRDKLIAETIDKKHVSYTLQCQRRAKGQRDNESVLQQHMCQFHAKQWTDYFENTLRNAILNNDTLTKGMCHQLISDERNDKKQQRGKDVRINITRVDIPKDNDSSRKTKIIYFDVELRTIVALKDTNYQEFLVEAIKNSIMTDLFNQPKQKKIVFLAYDIKRAAFNRKDNADIEYTETEVKTAKGKFWGKFYKEPKPCYITKFPLQMSFDYLALRAGRILVDEEKKENDEEAVTLSDIVQRIDSRLVIDENETRVLIKQIERDVADTIEPKKLQRFNWKNNDDNKDEQGNQA